jgi:tetratricopeptide (TPR) repeat protein
VTTKARRTNRYGAIALGVGLCWGCLACSERGAVREMRRAFEKGDYSEVVVVGRHSLRTDSTNARVLLYYGMALAAQDRLHEGFEAIDRAVKRDEATAKPAAEFLWESGNAGKFDVTAARKLAKAAELDTSLDLGKRRFAVADLYFSERRYDDAIRMYEDAVRLYADTTACENALARLAESYAVTDRQGDARRTMETLVKKYPRGEHAREAWVRLDDITYGEAQKALERGDLQHAAELADQLVGRTQNRSLQQKGRFVLGEAYERMGETGRAYAAYREIIESDRGDSGGVVERARERIEALQGAGQH